MEGLVDYSDSSPPHSESDEKEEGAVAAPTFSPDPDSESDEKEVGAVAAPAAPAPAWSVYGVGYVFCAASDCCGEGCRFGNLEHYTMKHLEARAFCSNPIATQLRP